MYKVWKVISDTVISSEVHTKYCDFFILLQNLGNYFIT